MNTIKIRFVILSLALIAALSLTACGSDAEVKLTAQPEAQAATAEQAIQPAAKGAQTEATQASAAPTEANTAEPAPINGNGSGNGALVSDLGFRPEVNGFNFENYGNESGARDLTAVEVQRMFGDQVCALKKDGNCVLTPTAQQWMEQTNKDMAGGHCEGLAALSLLMFDSQVKPATFGGPDAHELAFSSETLQREIAYWWATQAVNPTAASVIKGTPNDILDIIKKIKPGQESYTIGIYKRDGSGGHAITPYAVEDDGGGMYSILVYDNNYPNTTRKVSVDSGKNIWSYEAAVNPQAESELYEGDADTQTLDLTPTSARLNTQACPFCSDTTQSRLSSGMAAPAEAFNQIFLDGDGHLLLQDDQGNQLGYVNGKMVNAIPGARFMAMKLAKTSTEAPEPVYLLPGGLDVHATLDGTSLKEASTTDLVMIGKGFSVGVEDIALDPKQKDTIDFMPKDEAIVYDTAGSESPNFVVTVEQPGGNDYDFEVQGTHMKGGGTITVLLDTKKGNLVINTEKLKNEGNFSFSMTRYTDTDEETYTADNISLKAGAIVYIEYAKWKGNGSGLTFNVDTNGDGTIDDEYTMEDAVK